MKDSDVDVLACSPTGGERGDFDEGCETVGEGEEESWGSEGEEVGDFEGETSEEVESVEGEGGDGEGEAGGDVKGLGEEERTSQFEDELDARSEFGDGKA